MSAIVDVRAQAGRQISPEAHKVLRNTYMLLGLTLLPTVVGSTIGVQFPLTVGLGMYMILFLAVLIGGQIMIVKNRNSSAGIVWLLLFTAALGYFMGPLLRAALSFSNGVDMIAMAFGGTAATFFVLAGFATTTKKNFATPGIFKTLFIGMAMAFILSIAGAFLFKSSALSLAISAIFIPIASMYIVATLNNVVRGGETNYIMATLTVYIMLMNIFQSLLHFLMIFAGQRD